MTGKAKNSAYMKFINRQAVLNIIRKNPTSRVELSKQLGLTRAAITLIVDNLIQDRLVVETSIVDTKYGRKPVLLDLNPTSHYVIGLDISRDACYAGIVNIKGELIKKKKIDIDSCKNAYDAIQIISREIRKIVSDSRIDESKLLGIGLTAPGPLDIYSGCILNPPNFNIWHNVNILRELAQITRYKVIIENISNARAIAEKHYGQGKNFDNFLLIVVADGVGGGIIIDNRLYRGAGGFGNEFGHTSINYKGRLCNCGNRGCVETYASIPIILKEAGSAVSSWNEVVDRAGNGDETCRKIINRQAVYLASGIVNIMNLLELQAVILAGDIKYKPEILIKRIREITMATSITRNLRTKMILTSSIAENSEIISAASVMIENFFAEMNSAIQEAL